MGYHIPGKPLIIRRHDIPRCIIGGRLGNHFPVNSLVLIPVFTFRNIRNREFPVLLLVNNAVSKAFLLLFFRYMQENLNHRETVLIQIFFPVHNLFVSFIPDISSYQFRRHRPIFQQFVHTGNHNIFILWSVKYTDFSTGRKFPVNTPEVIMTRFFCIWCLKRSHLEPARIQLGKYMIDSPILTCRIHGLENKNNTIFLFCIQLFL